MSVDAFTSCKNPKDEKCRSDVCACGQLNT